MSVKSVCVDRWKPIVLGVLLGAVEAFAINKVSADHPNGWWWVLLVTALLGVAACAVWAVLLKPDRREGSAGQGAINSQIGDLAEGATNIQQSAGAGGRNVAVSADDSSFATYRVDHIENLTIGEPKRRETGEAPSK